MKNAKFVQDAKLAPARYYRNPSDVIRDRRLTNKDRLEILAAWEQDARARRNPDSGSAENDELQRLRRVRNELENSSETTADGASPNEQDTQDA
jgi:hypothetical protein